MGLSRRTGISTTRISMFERFELRLRDQEIASIAAALIEGLDRTPKPDEVETVLDAHR